MAEFGGLSPGAMLLGSTAERVEKEVWATVDAFKTEGKLELVDSEQN